MTIAPVDAMQAGRHPSVSDMQHRNIAPRRVVTEPRVVQRDRLATSFPSTAVKTLYNHPDVKIISFAAPGHRNATGNSLDSLEADVGGELPWWSPLERTIAVGAFCVYRAPGSVAFLNCGSALQPILPKSQCWCVDQQNSKFVLQIRRPYYWRIELPTSNAEQEDKARQFKDILEKVLLFEKTQCPFQRAFTVELPDAPEVKQKPWTPVASQSTTCSNSSKLLSVLNHETTALLGPEHRGDIVTSSNQQLATCPNSAACVTSKLGEMSCTTSAKTYEPEEGDNEHKPGSGASDMVTLSVPCSAVVLESRGKGQPGGQQRSAQLVESRSPISHRESQHVVHSAPRQISPATHHLQQGQDASFPPITTESNDPRLVDAYPSTVLSDVHEGMGSHEDLQRPKLRYFLGYRGGRSFTSPPQLALTASPPSKSMKSLHATQDTDSADTLSGGESSESFHSASSSLESDILSVPASHTSAQVYPMIPGAEDCRYESLEMTSNPSCVADHRRSRSNAEDEVDTLRDLEPEPSTIGSALDKHVDSTRRRPLRKHCSMPLDIDTTRELPVGHGKPPVDLKLSDSVGGRLVTLRSLPLAIVTKTYNILIGPPSHLVALMLRIAARICAGEWKGEDVGFAVTGQVIPVRWDYSSGDLGGWRKENLPEGSTEECYPWHDNIELQTNAIHDPCCTSCLNQS